MGRTFFRILSNLERDFSIDFEKKYLPEKRETLKRLIKFVESGFISESSVDKFICANFRISADEMTEKWNSIRDNKKKVASTFRGQVSVLSSKLFNFFKVDENSLGKIFYLEEISDEYTLIEKFLNVYLLDTYTTAERFSYSLIDFLNDYTYEKEYDIADCTNEIALMRLLDKYNLQALFESCDKDKLAYVFARLRAPLLMQTDPIVMMYNQGGNGKVPRNKYSIEMNTDKVEFYNKYLQVKPKKVKISELGNIKNTIEETEKESKNTTISELGNTVENVTEKENKNTINDTIISDTIQDDKIYGEEWNLNLSKDVYEYLKSRIDEPTAITDEDSYSKDLVEGLQRFLNKKGVGYRIDIIKPRLDKFSSYNIRMALLS